MKKIISVISVLGLIVLLSTTEGCYYDKAQLLYPTSTCDTTNVTYSGTIKPVINAYCSSCHSTAAGPTSGAGYILDTYAGFYDATVTKNRLMGSVNHASGYSAMPKGGGQLTSCTLSQFQAWINAGAKNN